MGAKKARAIKLASKTVMAVAAILGVYIFFRLTGVGYKCPVFELTGFRCAGCGNTRAVTALLDFDFAAALRYNYFFPAEFFYIGWVYFFSAREYLKNGKFNYIAPCKAVDIALLAGIIFWTVFRNAAGI